MSRNYCWQDTWIKFWLEPYRLWEGSFWFPGSLFLSIQLLYVVLVKIKLLGTKGEAWPETQ